MEEMRSYLQTLCLISAGMGPQRTFQASLKELLTLLAMKHPFLRPHLVIFDPETHTLRLYMADTVPRGNQIVYEPGVGVTGQVFASGRPVIVERLLGHPVFLSKFFERSAEEMASLAFLSVPVILPHCMNQEQRVVGVLSMDTPCAPRNELEDRCQFLQAVAGIIGTQAAYLQDSLSRRQQLAVSGSSSRMGGQPNSTAMIAVSKAMRLCLEQAFHAGNGRSSVLIMGESGTGKERLAEVIHTASSRRELPMVRFHGGGMPDELAERELFGYRKGAFPGAMQTQKGLFELAQCSTLYLDDVETLSLTLQGKILQVLQEQIIHRAGGGSPVEVDVRLICSATHPLEPLVAEGLFLQELYSRITAFPIAIPPLRERREDILPMAQFFMNEIAGRNGRFVERISVPAQELLMRYSWTGNIHELKHCITQAILNCEDKVLRAGHLPSVLQLQDDGSRKPEQSFSDAVARFEQELLTDALQRAQGNMLQAARDLQASYRIVNYKVKKYDIDPRKFIPTRNGS